MGAVGSDPGREDTAICPRPRWTAVRLLGADPDAAAQHLLRWARTTASTWSSSAAPATTSPTAPRPCPSTPSCSPRPPPRSTGPYDDILPHHGVTSELDYEAELGVIIGRGGRGISREDAFEHVWGYTIIDDFTARDLQRNHKQWLLGKSLDTHCPMGPYAVTADEIADVTALQVRELRQRRAAPERPGQGPDLRHPGADRDHLRGHHAAARRHHRHRHPGRGRDRVRPAEVPGLRRRHRDLDHRPRRAAQPHRRLTPPRPPPHAELIRPVGRGRSTCERQRQGTGRRDRRATTRPRCCWCTASAARRTSTSSRPTPWPSGCRVIRVDSAGAGPLPGGRRHQHRRRTPTTWPPSSTSSASRRRGVVGHSVGTLVVRELAARHPDKVVRAGPARRRPRARRGRPAGPARPGRGAAREGHRRRRTRRRRQRAVRDHAARPARGRRVRARARHAPGPGGLRPQLRGARRRHRPRPDRPRAAAAADHRRRRQGRTARGQPGARRGPRRGHRGDPARRRPLDRARSRRTGHRPLLKFL